MTKKISPITFNGTSKIDELDDSIVLFDEPLQIVGTNERQWNGTVYDLNSTDAAQWDGIITQNHDSKLTDVIGKAIGLFKNKQGIFIRGIKYATEINPVAVLAKNLLTHGFAPGFSCETLGPDPDENGIWHNHVVCGLSQVVHPNDKMAYAVVSNSLDEAEKAGFDTTDLRKEMNSVFEPWDETFKKINNDLEDSVAENDETVSPINQETTTLFYDKFGRKLKNGVDLSHQVLYNSIKDQINEGTDQMDTIITNAKKIGNPWHDEYGRFTFSPFGSVGYVGQNAGDRDSKGMYVGEKQGNYRVGYEKEGRMTFTAEVGSYGHAHHDYNEEKDGGYADSISVEDFTKELDAGLAKFREEAISRFTDAHNERLAEKQKFIEGIEKRKADTEKILSFDSGDVEKNIKKYENELRKANSKAEAKLKAGKELRLADFSKKTGAFSDDGNRFTEFALNGTEKGYGEAGRITRLYSDGDTFLSGTGADYGNRASNAANSEITNKYGSTYVDDYNGVPTSAVNYTDFYNKMIKSISSYKALEDMLNKQ